MKISPNDNTYLNHGRPSFGTNILNIANAIVISSANPNEICSGLGSLSLILKGAWLPIKRKEDKEPINLLLFG